MELKRLHAVAEICLNTLKPLDMRPDDECNQCIVSEIVVKIVEK